MSKTSETPQTNPLREGLATRAVPQACTVVIFGATGDRPSDITSLNALAAARG